MLRLPMHVTRVTVTVPVNPRVVEVTSNAAGGQGSKVVRQFNYDLCCHEGKRDTTRTGLRCRCGVPGFNQDDLFSHCGVQNLLHYALNGYSCTVRQQNMQGINRRDGKEGDI